MIHHEHEIFEILHDLAPSFGMGDRNVYFDELDTTFMAGWGANGAYSLQICGNLELSPIDQIEVGVIDLGGEHLGPIQVGPPSREWLEIAIAKALQDV